MNTSEMNNTKASFEEFVESFKMKLVKRYNWSVADAYNYQNEEGLKEAYEKGLSPEEAYFSLFNVAPDLQKN